MLISTPGSRHSELSSQIFAGVSGCPGPAAAIRERMAEATAPQISPDGYWWWDGSAWQPIASLATGTRPAGAEAHHAAAASSPAAESWPAWLPRTASAEAVLDSATAQQAGGGAVRVDEKVQRREREREVKAEQKRAHQAEREAKRAKNGQARAARTKRAPIRIPVPNLDDRTRILGGLAVLGVISLLGTAAEAVSRGHQAVAQPIAQPSAKPSKSSSEQSRADRFLTYSLSPAVTESVQAVAPLGMNCNTAFSRTCQDAINAADSQIQMSIAMIDRGAAPACVADPTKKVRGDLQSVHDNLQAALAGFPSNSHETVAAGVSRAVTAAQPLQADAAAAVTAKTTCAH